MSCLRRMEYGKRAPDWQWVKLKNNLENKRVKPVPSLPFINLFELIVFPLVNKNLFLVHMLGVNYTKSAFILIKYDLSALIFTNLIFSDGAYFCHSSAGTTSTNRKQKSSINPGQTILAAITEKRTILHPSWNHRLPSCFRKYGKFQV